VHYTVFLPLVDAVRRMHGENQQTIAMLALFTL
jgi:hypothetical protein